MVWLCSIFRRLVPVLNTWLALNWAVLRSGQILTRQEVQWGHFVSLASSCGSLGVSPHCGCRFPWVPWCELSLFLTLPLGPLVWTHTVFAASPGSLGVNPHFVCRFPCSLQPEHMNSHRCLLELAELYTASDCLFQLHEMDKEIFSTSCSCETTIIKFLVKHYLFP